MSTDWDDPIAKLEKTEAQRLKADQTNDLPVKSDSNNNNKSDLESLLDTMDVVDENKRYHKK